METNDICKILLNAAVYVPLFCALCTAVFAPFFGSAKGPTPGRADKSMRCIPKNMVK